MISAAPRMARATPTEEPVTERDNSRSSRWSRVPTSCSSAAPAVLDVDLGEL